MPNRQWRLAVIFLSTTHSSLGILASDRYRMKTLRFENWKVKTKNGENL